MPRRILTRRHWVLLAVALPLLLLGLGWGLPCAVSPEIIAPWGYDEIAPLAPLTEVYSLFSRTPPKYLAYPIFHHLLLTVSYAPYLLVQLLTGHLHPASTFPYGLDDCQTACRHLVLIARLVTVAMAVGIVFAVHDLTESLFDRRAALWVASMTAVLPLMVYYGKTSNLDVPYTLWTFLAMVMVARVVCQQARTRHYVLFGVFCALAVCTKDQAIGYVALLPIVLVGARLQQAAHPWGMRRLIGAAFGREMLLGLMASICTFALANNLILGSDRFVQHIQVAGEMAMRERAHAPDFDGQVHLLADCGQLFLWILGPALVVLALVGVACLVRRRRWAALGLLLLPVLGNHLLILGRVGYVYPRFLLPAAILLLIAAGAAIHYSSGSIYKFLVRPAALLGVAYLVVLALDIDMCLLNDPRLAAERWISEHVPEGAVVEAYCLHPCTLPRVWEHQRLSVVDVSGMSASGLRNRGPDYIVVMNLTEQWLWKHPQGGAYLGDLFGERMGYRKVMTFEPHPLVPVKLVNCIAPTVTILQKDPDDVSS